MVRVQEATRNAVSSAAVAQGFVRVALGMPKAYKHLELWASVELPYAQRGGTDFLFRQRDFVMIDSSDPSWIIVRVTSRCITFDVVVAHAPHSAIADDKASTWWESFRAAIRARKKPSPPLVMLIDANAAVGSVTSQHVGPFGAEDENRNGNHLQWFLLRGGHLHSIDV